MTLSVGNYIIDNNGLIFCFTKETHRTDGIAPPQDTCLHSLNCDDLRGFEVSLDSSILQPFDSTPTLFTPTTHPPSVNGVIRRYSKLLINMGGRRLPGSPGRIISFVRDTLLGVRDIPLTSTVS